MHQHRDARPDLYIDNLGVAPEWQRRGFGRRSMALTFEAGATAAWVGTEEDGRPANGLYKVTGVSGGRFMMFRYSRHDLEEYLEAQ